MTTIVYNLIYFFANWFVLLHGQRGQKNLFDIIKVVSPVHSKRCISDMVTSAVLNPTKWTPYLEPDLNVPLSKIEHCRQFNSSGS